MKAALVSATSLAALLAFDVGLDVAIDAHPASAQTFSVTPTSLSFGVVLLNSSGGTSSVLAQTVSNGVTGANTVTLPGLTSAAASPFTAAQTSAILTNTTGTGTHTLKNNYTFIPTVTGSFTGTTMTVLGRSITTTKLGIGNTVTNTVTGSAVLVLSGTAVAPVQKTSLVASTTTLSGVQSGTTVRIGTTATIAALTVANIGNGDIYSSSSLAAQLQATIGVPSNSVFTGAGSSFTLNDSHFSPTNTGTSLSVTNYTYAPTAHTGSTADSATVALTFANGNSAGTNATQTGAVTITGTGVGPAFRGVYNNTTYNNATAIGTSVNNAGTVSLGTQKPGTTVPFSITVSNATGDAASSLSNLTLNGFSLGTCVVTGCKFDGFSVLSYTTGAITEGNSVVVTLDFSGGLQTYYDADLSFDTDQGATGGVGGTGAVFSYLLTANIPEPATIVTFGMGLAGLGWARRRRAARRSAISTDASPA
jgi:hypothetical protein